MLMLYCSYSDDKRVNLEASCSGDYCVGLCGARYGEIVEWNGASPVASYSGDGSNAKLAYGR